MKLIFTNRDDAMKAWVALLAGDITLNHSPVPRHILARAVSGGRHELVISEKAPPPLVRRS